MAVDYLLETTRIVEENLKRITTEMANPNLITDRVEVVTTDLTTRTEVHIKGPGISIVASGMEADDLKSLVNSTFNGIVNKINNGHLKKGDKIHMELFVL
jgi:hypothetical protein